MIRKAVLFAVGVIALTAPLAYAFPPIDITAPSTSVTSAVDGTIWKNLNPNVPSAGTGYWNPFLRLQALGGDNGIEYGLNSDASVAEPLDNVSFGPDPHTHSVQFGQLAVVTISGVDYYSFELDFNEPSGGGQNFLSIDQIQIYSVDQSAGGSLASLAAVQGAAGSTLHYDMDGAADQTTYLDYDNSNTQNNQGSGVADMNLLIPKSFFAGSAATDYMYFYTIMGASLTAGADWDGEDGFEEWRVLLGEKPPDAAEPMTLMLMGGGLLGLLVTRNRKK